MEVGDLVWYYPAYGTMRYLCVIYAPHDFHGLMYHLYDFERDFSFVTSKSCIKKLDKF